MYKIVSFSFCKCNIYTTGRHSFASFNAMASYEQKIYRIITVSTRVSTDANLSFHIFKYFNNIPIVNWITKYVELLPIPSTSLSKNKFLSAFSF